MKPLYHIQERPSKEPFWSGSSNCLTIPYFCQRLQTLSTILFRYFDISRSPVHYMASCSYLSTAPCEQMSSLTCVRLLAGSITSTSYVSAPSSILLICPLGEISNLCSRQRRECSGADNKSLDSLNSQENVPIILLFGCYSIGSSLMKSALISSLQRGNGELFE